ALEAGGVVLEADLGAVEGGPDLRARGQAGHVVHGRALPGLVGGGVAGGARGRAGVVLAEDVAAGQTIPRGGRRRGRDRTRAAQRHPEGRCQRRKLRGPRPHRQDRRVTIPPSCRPVSTRATAWVASLASAWPCWASGCCSGSRAPRAPRTASWSRCCSTAATRAGPEAAPTPAATPPTQRRPPAAAGAPGRRMPPPTPRPPICPPTPPRPISPRPICLTTPWPPTPATAPGPTCPRASIWRWGSSTTGSSTRGWA